MSTKKKSIIKCIDWRSIAEPDLPLEVAGWLMEAGSMTERFERHCHNIIIDLKHEGFIEHQALSDEKELLPESPRYWIREVVMCADDEPWLLGRTVIPQDTLSGPEHALLNLGKTPLGRYLFSSKDLKRDYIQTGRQGDLWARRSLLQLSNKPLLLTEVFLPASPLYCHSRNTKLA
ncbi:MAG: chorismate lyase [Candidatus Hamiltonella defensa (Ceratovacuna japonica)]